MAAGDTGPRRRATDHHYHPEMWTKDDHHRFEERVDEAIDRLTAKVEGFGNRLTLMLGGLALLAFLLPLIAPFVRSWLGVPVTP